MEESEKEFNFEENKFVDNLGNKVVILDNEVFVLDFLVKNDI